MPVPLVTAIIPAFNGQRFLRSTLDSVFSQDYPNAEVVVVDDGSTDDSASIAQSYPQVRYIWQANQGPAVARNTGIAAARGDLLAFLDQDDQWLPNKLTVQVDYLLCHPEVGYVLAWQHLFLEPGSVAPPSHADAIDKDEVGHFPSTLVARREVFDLVGGYGPDTPPAENADWFSRANDAGVAKAILPQVLALKRFHDSNSGRNTDLVRAKVLRALKASADRKRAARR